VQGVQRRRGAAPLHEAIQVQSLGIPRHEKAWFPDFLDSSPKTILNLIAVPTCRAKPNRVNMCKIGESLVVFLKRTTDPHRRLESRHPGRIPHNRRAEPCVQTDHCPVTDSFHSIPLATIPIQWSPKMFWPACIRFTRPA
jgi:hypothetical protein